MNFTEAKALTIQKWRLVLKTKKYSNEGCAFCQYSMDRAQDHRKVSCEICPAFKAFLCHDTNPFPVHDDGTQHRPENKELLYWRIHCVQADPQKLVPLVEELITKLEALTE